MDARYVSIPKRVLEALNQKAYEELTEDSHVSIPKRVLEALNLEENDEDTAEEVRVSIPKRVLEALNPQLCNSVKSLFASFQSLKGF